MAVSFGENLRLPFGLHPGPPCIERGALLKGLHVQFRLGNSKREKHVPKGPQLKLIPMWVRLFGVTRVLGSQERPKGTAVFLVSPTKRHTHVVSKKGAPVWMTTKPEILGSFLFEKHQA